MIQPLTIIDDEINSRQSLIQKSSETIEKERLLIEQLDREIQTLTSLRQRIEKSAESVPQNGRMGPTDAILKAIRDRGVLTTSEIADEVIGHFVSSSKNKRRLVYSLLDQLRKSGRVYRDTDGKFSLVEER